MLFMIEKAKMGGLILPPLRLLMRSSSPSQPTRRYVHYSLLQFITVGCSNYEPHSSNRVEYTVRSLHRHHACVSKNLSETNSCPILHSVLVSETVKPYETVWRIVCSQLSLPAVQVALFVLQVKMATLLPFLPLHHMPHAPPSHTHIHSYSLPPDPWAADWRSPQETQGAVKGDGDLPHLQGRPLDLKVPLQRHPRTSHHQRTRGTRY